MEQGKTAETHPPVPVTEKLKGLAGIFGIHLGEMPPFEVIESEGPYEIRRYAPMVTASANARGPWELARSEAFQRLADYIFGKNETGEKLPMTAPVLQSSERLTTASPIFHETPLHGLQMSFILPAGLSLANAPKPLESLISLSETPAQIVAVLRYSGINDLERIEEHTRDLLQWVRDKNLRIESVRVAEYDAPFVIPFLRRNEIQVITKSASN